MRLTTLVLSCLLAAAAVGCAPSGSAELEANKDLVQRFTDAVNAANWDSLDEIMTDDFARHSEATAGPPVESREAFIQLQESFLVSFPDQRVTTEKLIAEGDLVAGLATYSATHTGPMGDVPATGRSLIPRFSPSSVSRAAGSPNSG